MSSYQVRVRAVHGHGREGAWSDPGQWSPPPELAGSRLMKAWLSRFGRTVADQVIDAVTGRLEEPEDSAGLDARVAGLDPVAARDTDVRSRWTVQPVSIWTGPGRCNSPVQRKT